MCSVGVAAHRGGEEGNVHNDESSRVESNLYAKKHGGGQVGTGVKRNEL